MSVATVPASRRGWIVFTRFMTAAVFVQAITAGRILSGDSWARDAHRSVAGLLVLAAVAGGLIAFVRLRERNGGRRFGLALVAVGVGLFAQYALGMAAADGEDTLWLHIPIGVALLGFTMRLDSLVHRIEA